MKPQEMNYCSEGKPKSLSLEMKERNLFLTIPPVDVSTWKSDHITSHQPISHKEVISSNNTATDTIGKDDDDDPRNHTVQEPAQGLCKIALDLGYFTAIIPYRIAYDVTSKEFVTRRNKFQMVICAMFHTLTVFSMFSHMRALPRDMPIPTLYFQFFRRALLVVTIVAWIKTLWSKSNEFKMLVVQSCMALSGNYRKAASRTIATFCTVYFVTAILGLLMISGKTYFNPIELFNAYEALARRIFHLENGPPEETSFRDENHTKTNLVVSKENIVLFFIQLLLELGHDGAVWFLYAVMISIVIVVWFSVKSFHDKITNSCSASDDDAFIIYQKFSALKEMFNNANSILGLTLLAWVGYVVPFTPLRVSEMISLSSDWFLVLFNIIYLFHFVIFFALAADSCAKVGYMKHWIIRDDIMVQFDIKKYNALLMEFSSQPVALQSYRGAFSITYEFIGNLRL